MPASGLDESAYSRAQIGELKLAWTESGPAHTEAPDSEPPLVLVHGFTGHRDDWIGVIPTLARHRRTIAVDLRGHGNSDSPESASLYTFEHFVKDLEGLLEHLEIPRCDLLGHSVGGMIALRFALAHPERLRSLILMSSAPEVPPLLSVESWRKAAEIAEARGLDFLQTIAEKAGRAEPDPILSRWGERYWRHHRRRLRAMSPASYRGVGRSIFDSASLVPRLSELTLPCLVLVGDADLEFLPGADLFERHLPNVRRITIAKAGHHPHQECEAAWLDALDGHFSRLRTEALSESASDA